MNEVPRNAMKSRTDHGYSLLTIPNVRKENAGKYTCRGYKKKKMKFEHSAILKVTGKYYIDIQCYSHVKTWNCIANLSLRKVCCVEDINFN